MQPSTTTPPGTGLPDLRRGFRSPPPDSRVMVRWWFGPFVEEDELARELEAMAAAGLGRVEVAFPSPTAPAPDGGSGSLGGTLLRHLRFAAERAAAGAEGLVLDHCSGAAARVDLDAVAEPSN